MCLICSSRGLRPYLTSPYHCDEAFSPDSVQTFLAVVLIVSKQHTVFVHAGSDPTDIDPSVTVSNVSQRIVTLCTEAHKRMRNPRCACICASIVASLIDPVVIILMSIDVFT
ncbi:hypothetical protein RRG08_012671 [Elysia crispata]|uniref:Uncharacterized protein n=1 Tax=Elysia crispata TaxID=231223 RepID=A0AAE0YMX1_9GAST|nr:hypothetical protein RRG08_012671 [Elysia crispata]